MHASNLDDFEESATAKGRLGRGYLPLGEREGGRHPPKRIPSCQSLLCGQVKKQQGKVEVERLRQRELQAPAQHRTLTCAHCSMVFFRFGVLRYPAQREAHAKGTFSKNPKESLVAEDALVGHAEATKITDADLVVTHPKRAYLQSISNSTR